MAGIGFELRKLLGNHSYAGLLRAYTYAGIISSGPWVLSIIGIMLIGVASIGAPVPHGSITEFQVTVTYIIATSLMLTGAVQIAFTRFVADRLFEKRSESVLPNFNGMLMIVTLASGGIGLIAVTFLFPAQPVLYRLLVLNAFVTMCGIWVTAVFLAGMKKYLHIVWLFFLGYAIVVALAIALRPYGTEGLLFSFVIGHFVLLMGMIALVYQHYPSDRLIGFDLFKRKAMFTSLMLAGLFYNAGIWADKFIFWFNPDTSHEVIGWLRGSVIYDYPIFLAYLAIVPGMAVFLVRIETDFVDDYNEFYGHVRDGAPLKVIERTRNHLVSSARQGLLDIAKIQAITVLTVFAAGPALLDWIGISQNYLPLLYVDVVGASLQVVLLGILNILFYLDKRSAVVWVTLLFLLGNIALTMLSQALGADYYGYGYALAVLLSVVAGLTMLARHLEMLEYETFMLQ